MNALPKAPNATKPAIVPGLHGDSQERGLAAGAS